MKNILLKLSGVLGILLFVCASNAHADGLVRAGFGYGLDSLDTGGGESKTTRQYMDFGGGYKFASSGFAILGQYSKETVNTTSPGSSVTGNRTSYGAGVGWFSPSSIGVYGDAIYFISSEFEQSGTTYSGGGYVAEFGMKVDISQVFLTAGFAYEGFTYTKTQSGSLTHDRVEKHLAPRIGLQFQF